MRCGVGRRKKIRNNNRCKFKVDVTEVEDLAAISCTLAK